MGYCYANGNMYGRGDYYRGDYYRGDYYRGDPGFSLGGLLRGAFKAATSLLPGGFIVQQVASTAGSILKQATRSPRPVTPGNALVPLQATGGIQVMSQGGLMNLGIQQFGGLPGGGGGGGGAIVNVPGVGLCRLPSGRGGHFNKSTYITRGGGTSHWPQQLLVHPKGTECVRPRRLNVANPRALRRSLRRIQGFAKLARRVLHFTHPRAARGRATFKFARKRK